MKKLLIVCGTIFALCFVSCTSKKEEGGKTSELAQKNINASHTVMKAFETGDVSAIDSVVADNFVDHTDRGEMGRDSLKAAIKMMHIAMPDTKMEIIKELADDEYVFSLSRTTGTCDGSMGMPKGPVDMKSLEVVKFKDGKAIEHWSYMEMTEMMKMMPQPKMDTAR